MCMIHEICLMGQEQYLPHATFTDALGNILTYRHLLIIFQSQLAQTKAMFKWIDWGLNSKKVIILFQTLVHCTQNGFGI